MLLIFKAYLALIQFDVLIARRDFSAIYNKVRHCPVASEVSSQNPVGRICFAINMACIWYWKEVLCLQRSAAAACLLKAYGVDAQMIVGVQQIPFKAHAWIEVDGHVVNDKSYMTELYRVLDRC